MCDKLKSVLNAIDAANALDPNLDDGDDGREHWVGFHNFFVITKYNRSVMYALAALTDKYSAEGRRLRPLELVAEYEKTILDELDLMREGANTAQLKRNFVGHSSITKDGLRLSNPW